MIVVHWQFRGVSWPQSEETELQSGSKYWGGWELEVPSLFVVLAFLHFDKILTL